MERPNSQEKQFINVDREIMVEIVNLCHFNEPQKLMPLLKYTLPDWVKNINGIYFQDIYLKNDPKSSMIYQELPGNLLVFMWEQEGIAYASCFLSTSDDYKPRDYDFDFDFSDMDDNDCDWNELGWYYWMSKDINLDKITNYKGENYVPVFRKIGERIECCTPPLIRHHYRLEPLVEPEINTGYDALRLILEDSGQVKKSKASIQREKYYDLRDSGNWNAKYAIARGRSERQRPQLPW